MSAALLDAVRTEKLRPGASVVVLYNGIESGDEENPGMDSLSVIRLGDHLELLSAKELKRLDTQVPLGTLQAVVDLATQIGREGREGQPIGTMFVVGDTQKVMKHSSPMNFNPFRGYSAAERDVRNPVVGNKSRTWPNWKAPLSFGGMGWPLPVVCGLRRLNDPTI